MVDIEIKIIVAKTEILKIFDKKLIFYLSTQLQEVGDFPAGSQGRRKLSANTELEWPWLRSTKHNLTTEPSISYGCC